MRLVRLPCKIQIRDTRRGQAQAVHASPRVLWPVMRKELQPVNTHFIPIGTLGAQCHHMPESYYERHEALRKAYKRAVREGRLGAAMKAARKLSEHENSHNTN